MIQLEKAIADSGCKGVHYKKQVVREQDTYTITRINLHDIRKLESHSFATTLLDKRVQGALCLFVD